MNRPLRPTRSRSLAYQHFLYRGHADFSLGHFTPGAGVNSVAWSPDGTHIASVGTDGTVQVWLAAG